jgi:hypothetical protein
MLQAFAGWAQRRLNPLLAAGVLSNGYGPPAADQGFGEILGTSVLGGFLGLICGMIITQIMRYISFVTGRNLGGHTWIVLGTVVGMLAFAVAALTLRED